MARETDRAVALMPIRPRFASSIMKGQKRVEFRRVAFRNRVTHVVVYASSPVKKIVGYFEVSLIDKDSPEKLWKKYGHVGGICLDEFMKYYADTDRGMAIVVKRVHTFKEPIPLSTLGAVPVPQSFSYLPEKVFDVVRMNECDN